MLKTKKTLKGVLKMELAYRMEGDYWIPNLVAPEAPALGKYGMLRRSYLRQHRSGTYTGMMLSSKLDQHLGGDIPLACLVIGVADLCTFQIRRNILLQQITILPQIPDTLIHGAYLKGFI